MALTDALMNLHVQAVKLVDEYQDNGRRAELADLENIWRAIDQLTLIVAKHMATHAEEREEGEE